jgi:hypothetical protein
LIGIISTKRKANISVAVVVARLNWLIISILVKIKPVRMAFIAFVKNVVIVKPKVFNPRVFVLLKY